MKEKIFSLFNYKNASIHMVVLAFLVGIFTLLSVNLHYDATFIIAYIIMGLVTLFITVELVFITVVHAKNKKGSIYYLLNDYRARELLLAPVGTLLSLYFAMTHFVVFHITGLWYFCILNVVYLIGLSIKLFQVFVDETFTIKKSVGLFLSNVFMMVLSLCFLGTIFFTNSFKDVLHEPVFLFVLDIVFFFLKLVFAVIGLISAFRHKSDLMVSYSFTALILSFYSFYSVIIALLHKNHLLTSNNIFIAGLTLSITSLIMSIVILTMNTIKYKK